ncbi:hypothetical protein [Ruminococcus sp.]|uniref:hypothetical protein n=1 Tax=Ruminococcus sp. TaxID=41978 RepID=UPI003522CC3E
MNKKKGKEKLHSYLQILKADKKCPVCGEECISWYKKGLYKNFWREKECPNCKATLKLEGKIIWINRMITLLFWLDYIILLINVPQLCPVVLILYICFKYVCDLLVVSPFTKLVPYNSTPLDDLVNMFKKLRTLNLKGKIMVAVGTTVVVLAAVGIGVCINHWGSVKNQLAGVTNDIAEESCDNYGDYSKSKYRDIVSEEIYKKMNYLYEEDCSDKSNLDIYVIEFTDMEVQLLSLKSAEVNYQNYINYQVNTDNSRYIANRSNCTVQWVLEDNVWRVSGYDERS